MRLEVGRQFKIRRKCPSCLNDPVGVAIVVLEESDKGGGEAVVWRIR